MNLITIDTQSVFSIFQVGGFVVSAPPMVLLSIILICVEMGWVGLLIPFVVILMSTANSVLGSKLIKLRKATLLHKDKRTKYFQEFLQGIRVIKVKPHPSYQISESTYLHSGPIEPPHDLCLSLSLSLLFVPPLLLAPHISFSAPSITISSYSHIMKILPCKLRRLLCVLSLYTARILAC